MAKSKRQIEAISSGMGVFVAIISGLVELVKSFGGSMEDLYKLGTPEGRQKLEAIACIVVGKETELKNEFLKLISGNETLTIDACDGTKILAEANDVFKYVDLEFKSWSADRRGQATVETSVEVYEIEKDATFVQMFSSLSSDVRRLCFTQNQIIDFVKKHRKWLQTIDHGTFFLFESTGEIFVANVSVESGGLLWVEVFRFGHLSVWHVGIPPRLVIPKLA
ncbi:MAG: hypothetical protein WAV16_02855 [Candidatus Moraniibacteriota bacterium]